MADSIGDISGMADSIGDISGMADRVMDIVGVLNIVGPLEKILIKLFWKIFFFFYMLITSFTRIWKINN